MTDKYHTRNVDPNVLLVFIWAQALLNRVTQAKRRLWKNFQRYVHKQVTLIQAPRNATKCILPEHQRFVQPKKASPIETSWKISYSNWRAEVGLSKMPFNIGFICGDQKWEVIPIVNNGFTSWIWIWNEILGMLQNPLSVLKNLLLRRIGNQESELCSKLSWVSNSTFSMGTYQSLWMWPQRNPVGWTCELCTRTIWSLLSKPVFPSEEQFWRWKSFCSTCRSVSTSPVGHSHH